MFEENDDVENNQNDEDYSDNEEISDHSANIKPK